MQSLKSYVDFYGQEPETLKEIVDFTKIKNQLNELIPPKLDWALFLGSAQSDLNCD